MLFLRETINIKNGLWAKRLAMLSYFVILSHSSGDVVRGGRRLREADGHFTDDRKPTGFDTKQIFVSPSIRYSGDNCYSKVKEYVYHSIFSRDTVIPASRARFLAIIYKNTRFKTITFYFKTDKELTLEAKLHEHLGEGFNRTPPLCFRHKFIRLT